MNNLVDWEYYNSHFPNLNDEEFEKIVYEAERRVLKRISKSMDNLSDDERIDVKDCICDVINQIYSINSHNGISSISNDGYSESYISLSDEEIEEKFNSILHKWLDSSLLKGYFIGF